MPSDKAQFLGLNTDSPPDRLGNQLMRVENVVPISPDSVAPRPGVSLVAHYQPMQSGRVVIADALPGSVSDGFMIVVANSTGIAWTIDGIFKFKPPSSSAMAAGYGPGGDGDLPGGLDSNFNFYAVVI